ncbi:MAG: hypothetical protein AB1Z98_03450, partial [Nannocystaceae bacterium]
MMLRFLTLMSFALGVGADAAAPESTTPTTTPSKTAPAALEPVAIEACDGTRTRTARDPALLACSRWRVDWREQGVVRGLVVADGYDAVIEARERQLAFARDYARFFDAPVDARFTDPGPPVCDTCESSVPKGRWGEGQLLGDGPSVRAVAEARPLVNALASVVEPRLPTLRDVARLAREPSMAKAAKEHAQQTRQALLELSELRLALDEAAVLRSVKIANDVSTASRKRAEALEASSAALLAALGSAVNKAHGGTYVEDGNAGAEAPRLQIELDGASVTATYRVGGASST